MHAKCASSMFWAPQRPTHILHLQLLGPAAKACEAHALGEASCRCICPRNPRALVEVTVPGRVRAVKFCCRGRWACNGTGSNGRAARCWPRCSPAVDRHNLVVSRASRGSCTSHNAPYQPIVACMILRPPNSHCAVAQPTARKMARPAGHATCQLIDTF